LGSEEFIKWLFFYQRKQKKLKSYKPKRSYCSSSSAKTQSNQFFLNSLVNDKRIKATFRCPLEYKDDFSDSIAQVTISLGKDIHEESKLVSTLGLVNSHFRSCVIMLDDSIQWYTNSILNPHLPPRILIQEAYEAGNSWLSRNKKAYEMLTIPYRIVRWDDVLLQSEFEPTRLQVTRAYYQNPDYQKAINENIAEFLGRIEKKYLSSYDKDRAFVLCLNYLLEECAGMIMWAEKYGCHYEVYPSGRNQSMEATYKFFIQTNHPDLLKPVGVRFSKRNIDRVYYEKIIDENDSQSKISMNLQD
jgi:hypothetical protein